MRGRFPMSFFVSGLVEKPSGENNLGHGLHLLTRNFAMQPASRSTQSMERPQRGGDGTGAESWDASGVSDTRGTPRGSHRGGTHIPGGSMTLSTQMAGRTYQDINAPTGGALALGIVLFVFGLGVVVGTLL